MTAQTITEPQALTTARRCTCVLIDYDVLCQEPVEVEAVMGCVNEHLDTETLCAGHRQLALAGALVCTECAPLGVWQRVHVLSENGRRIRR
jgi:hypothetical protein